MLKSDLRITTGTVKNKKLFVPQIEGFRAVQDVMKMSVFSYLEDITQGAVVLDLYAGSGSMGLEALSRGAAWCDFVDEDYESISTITRNVIDCGFAEFSQVMFKNAVKFVGKADKVYDIVFMDPFYDDTNHKFMFKELTKVTNKYSYVFYFHKKDLNTDFVTEAGDWKLLTMRGFGGSEYSVFKRA